MEPPLYDLAGRTLCVGSGASVAEAVDALLRMNASPNSRQTPITLYLGLGGQKEPPLSALEAVQLSSLIGALRSPVHTVGIGLLRGFEMLVLAAGQRQHRHLLPHALLCVSEIEISNLQLPKGAAGLNTRSHSLRELARTLLTGQIRCLASQLGLAPGLWDHPRLLTARQAIELGLADQLVPTFSPQPMHSHELAPTPPSPQF